MKLKFKTRQLRLASVAVLGLASALAAMPAYAADAEQGSDNDQNGGGLQEIVVTAQHREENLRSVPIAVNAISSDALQNSGVSSTAALVQAVPSLNFTRSGPSGIFVIRGVATPNGAAGEEGSTAVYVDDVYMPDLSQTINNFNNIQRIEVLNGPQGTLFGRNATGGLIRVITKDPGDETTINAVGGYSNFDTVSGQVYFSTPISEKVGWDIAFTGQHQGKGWGYDKTLNQDVRADNHWGLRSKLVFKPSDNLKVTLAGDYYKTDDTTAIYIFPISITPATGVANGPISGVDSLAGFAGGTHIRVWGVSGKVELETGIGTVTSITSYRKQRNTSAFDVDGAAADLYHLNYKSGNQTFQQELRLSSATTEPLSWQLGAFYLHVNAFNDQYQAGLALKLPAPSNAPITSHIDSRGVTDSVSVFGEATYALTPTTHLTGGVRWTSDHRKLPLGYVDTIVNATGAIISHRTNPIDSATFNQVTFRAALRQDLSDSVSVYASVNKGFKAGQFNLQVPYDTPVKPQTIMAYEGGLKGDFLDRHLRVSLAGYHYDIKNYQVRSTVGTVTALQNAAKVKIDGVDINAEAVLTDRFHLTVGASWLNARYDEFGGPGTGVTAPGYYPCGCGNATGNQTALAPHFTLNIGGTYTIPLKDESELRLTANFSHKSSYVFEPDNVLRQPAYDVVNASVEYKINDNFGIEAWMKNIGDRYYNVQMVTSVGQAALSAAPRQYGVNFKINY